jgi:DNA-binding beta-propeller fold protein YncE
MDTVLARDQRDRRRPAGTNLIVLYRDFEMVQHFLTGAKKSAPSKCLVLAAVLLCLTVPDWAASRTKQITQPHPPDILMDGGRKLTFERTFSFEQEVKPKRGFWTRVVDVIAGEPDFHYLVNPYSITTDSRGRIIVTDPGARGVHVFDFEGKKYKFLTRRDNEKNPMIAPQCVAVDAQDNIYVTDSEAGKIFVFDSNGKFRRLIGSLKGGEGYFKRPTGIAVDSAGQHIYITDTLRNQIFMLDMQGSVLRAIGKTGTGNGEFNSPTELRIFGNQLAVVDTMNFRVQVLAKDGTFAYAIGKPGDGTGWVFRPKGIGFDTEGHLYIVDALWGVVQVFDEQGRLLYYFGGKGTGLGQFQLPAGLQIDKNNRIYVVDSFNRRVQVFHYYGLPTEARNQ